MCSHFLVDLLVHSQYGLGVTLKEWMEKNGVTITEVAVGTGVQPASLSRYLRGKAGLSLESAHAIVGWVREKNAARETRGRVEYDDLVPVEDGAKP